MTRFAQLAQAAELEIMGVGERRPSSRVPLVTASPWYFDRAKNVVYTMKHDAKGDVKRVTLATLPADFVRTPGNGLLIAQAPAMLMRLMEIDASGLLDGPAAPPFMRDNVWMVINDVLADTEPALIFRGA